MLSLLLRELVTWIRIVDDPSNALTLPFPGKLRGSRHIAITWLQQVTWPKGRATECMFNSPAVDKVSLEMDRSSSRLRSMINFLRPCSNKTHRRWKARRLWQSHPLFIWRTACHTCTYKTVSTETVSFRDNYYYQSSQVGKSRMREIFLISSFPLPFLPSSTPLPFHLQILLSPKIPFSIRKVFTSKTAGQLQTHFFFLHEYYAKAWWPLRNDNYYKIIIITTTYLNG